VRLLLAFVVAAPFAAFAACSSFEDGATPSDADSGADSGTVDAVVASDADAGDGGAAFDAEAAAPPGMILVQTTVASFWIDAREVTTGEFSAFREKLAQGDAGLPAVCAFKTGLGPTTSCDGKPASTAVGCVDWCDAFAYCKFAGKRLCGRINGGAALEPTEATDRFKSEWMRACAGALGSAFPYGQTPDASACNTNEALGEEVYDAGSMPGCVGAEDGLYDMSGNVEELIDSCNGDSGAGDTCVAQGGSFIRFADNSRCQDTYPIPRDFVALHLGFRCCKDP
jgi:sulfatase modifying factor 1